NLRCDYQKTKCFSFSVADDQTEDTIHSTPKEVQWHTPEAVKKWCALPRDYQRDILTLIPPPEDITSRHMAIARQI
ncbi:hypothetical protein ABVT39_003776, partial [Epinephelus coioides]